MFHAREDRTSEDNREIQFNSIQFKQGSKLLLFFYFVFQDLVPVREIQPLAPIELRVKFKLAQRSQ